jgi:isopentenyl diphosphate isomerase/L-lactate dehydrogenase-like FMN-dependent dehydrogenase
MLLNVDDYRRAARRRLPRGLFDLIDGGAGDEVTLRRNRTAFERIALRPRLLADASSRDLRTTVLGQPVSMPVLLDPTAHAHLIHSDGELGVARAAAGAGIVYALSTLSDVSLERLAAETTGPKWFQLYAPPDRAGVIAVLDRAQAAGYEALCVTVDVPVGGLRERARRSHMPLPPQLTPRLVAQAAMRPRWTIDFLAAKKRPGGVAVRSAPTRPAPSGSRFITEDDLALIRHRWPRPLLIKGVQRGDEVQRLIELGVDGLVVSNHGGRQLDGVAASIEILPEVVAAAAGRVEVFLDSGIRRGTDVVKALALGARAVLIGRPYLYGLAVGGEAGVVDVIETLRAELDNAMALLGLTAISELGLAAIQIPSGFGSRSDAGERLLT